MNKILFVYCLLGYINISWGANELREMEHAEAIEASFSTGKVVWIDAQGKKFLTLYTETEQVDSLGAVIILHPMDGHADQQKIINPLRTYLPAHHWATLSVQLPVLGLEASEREYYQLIDDARVRIQESLEFLLDKKVKNIVLIGYGLGGMMAIDFVNESPDSDEIDALVTISLSVPESDHKHVQVIDFIGNIKQPFLDIFAEFDLPVVTDSARKRRLAGNENLLYRQIRMEGEGHLFQHDEGLLVKRVYSWINRTFREMKPSK
ncbi:MAG: DUF3530 domain-containing protein [Gammaproteobacteria bacterium]|nr:MAG: DUF3530 domain-containing protein [Gammaproteobacteria bacterium]